MDQLSWHSDPSLALAEHQPAPALDIWTTTERPALIFRAEPGRVALPMFCQIEQYERLQNLKDQLSKYSEEQRSVARAKANPFEELGRSIFSNRAGVKLANTDAVLHLAPDIFTLDKIKSDRPFTFADIASGPGSFTQYWQYRYPASKGYGITLAVPALDWTPEMVNFNNFQAYYGPDGTGDLYRYHDQFVQLVLSRQPTGVDVVTGDGGFDTDDDPGRARQQEFLSSRLLLCQAIVGIGAVRQGGNFLVKVFDTVTLVSAQIIYLLSLCFREVILFKPVSSRPANGERYLVCRDRRPEISYYYDGLVNLANRYPQDGLLISLYQDSLPPVFVDWLTRNNNRGLQRQEHYVALTLAYLTGQNPPREQYSLLQLPLIWSIPSSHTKVNKKTKGKK